jgi:outer membrane protein OmpA-like peptidoglycan-associated protein
MKQHTLFLIVLMACMVFIARAQDKDNRFDIVIKNEVHINSSHLEFSPVFFEDGILFISSRDNVFKYVDRRLNKSTMGIFQARRDAEGILRKPEFFSNRINTKYHEGPMCFDVSGNDMYFTRNNYVGGKLRKSSEGIVNLKVLKASRSGDSWGDVRDLPINGDDFNTAHPSLTADGDRLYFASDRLGGYGGLDIYYVEKMGDDYGDPVNLGPEVNTAGDEIFPFIHSDGTLYFSSNGRDGLGGLDIFYTRQSGNGNWESAVNLGAPFNSEKDDFGLIVDLETKNGYFSSDRPGGEGLDDIYSFYVRKGLNQLLREREAALAKEPLAFRVFVADAVTGNEVAGAMVAIWDLEEMNLSDALTITDEQGNLIRIQTDDPETNELILRVDMADAENKGFTDRDGMFESAIASSPHVIAVNAAGYLPRHVVVEREGGLDEILILLEPIGDRIPFSGVVLDPRYNTPVAGAKVTITDDVTGETITLYTDRFGQYYYYLPKERDFTVTVEKDDMKSSRKVSTKGLADGAEIAIAMDIRDKSGRNIFADGSVIRLPNIYYNFNDASIRPDARSDLDALVTILKQFPDLRIELASHTDSRGSDAYNMRLSQRRADNAAKYLINKGIAQNRLKPVGYGERQLKNHCKDGVECSEAEHQLNRRTEFRVIGSPNVQIEYTDNQPQVIDKAPGAGTTPSAPRSSATTEEPAVGQRGAFAVIAGTFGNRGNADRRLTELRNLGYNQAALVAANKGLNAVQVAIFSEAAEAEALVNALRKDHRIDAYVKRQ